MTDVLEKIETVTGQQKPDTIHGRLLEAVHVSGYTFERACTELEWLLKEERWQTIGSGYKDIDDFLATIDFSAFKLAVEQRKNIAKKLTDLRATQRATAKVLGITQATVSRDLDIDTNVSKPKIEAQQKQDISRNSDTNVSKPPSSITQSGEAVAKLADKAANNKEKKEERQAERKEAIKAKAKDPLPENVLLYEGDFFDHIGSVKEKSIDLIVADPPYMITGEEWDAFSSMEEFMDFTGRWLLAVTRTLKDTGRMFILFSPDHLYDLFALIKKNDFYGMEYANTIIWVKKNNNKIFGRNRYRLTYEPIIYLRGKSAANLNFPDDTFGETQTDVWTVATPQTNFLEGKFHPAQKPIEIYNRIITTASNEGDTVLDPFAGSGTTALSCTGQGRNCILIEKDADYCELIKGRINGMERYETRHRMDQAPPEGY